MELKGKIIHIGDIQTFASGFQKREFVIETEEQYKQEISLELFGDKIDIIDAHKIGDTVDVGINIRGKSHTNPQGQKRWFNSLVAWKITRPTASQPQSNKVPTASAEQAFGNPFEDDGEDSENLPF